MQGHQSSSPAVTGDQLAAVDEMFDVMVKNVFAEGAVIEADREDVLGGLVAVFDDRVRALERGVEEKGGQENAPPAMVGQLNCYVGLRGKAMKRFRQETGKEWAPLEA